MLSILNPMPNISALDWDSVPLQSGVCWPDNINPKLRETYLSEEEFKEVFGMDHVQFSKLPGWKRDMLKKRTEIF